MLVHTFIILQNKPQQLLKPESGMAWFRMAVMDQLSLLWQQESWAKTIKGERK